MTLEGNGFPPGQSMTEAIGDLAAALAVAQGQMRAAAKDEDNPFFKSRYASLASVWDACRKPLADNGLAIIQMTQNTGLEITVITMLVHSSGQWVKGEITLALDKATPQAIGSALSYGRRYGLAAMVGATQEDDDGEINEGETREERPRRVTSRPERPQSLTLQAGRVSFGLNPQTRMPICLEHGIDMQKRTGKSGGFWACPHREAATGLWCQYRLPSGWEDVARAHFAHGGDEAEIDMGETGDSVEI